MSQYVCIECFHMITFFQSVHPQSSYDKQSRELLVPSRLAAHVPHVRVIGPHRSSVVELLASGHQWQLPSPSSRSVTPRLRLPP